MKLCEHQPCSKPLQRRPDESSSNFNNRRYCSTACNNRERAIIRKETKMAHLNTAATRVVYAPMPLLPGALCAQTDPEVWFGEPGQDEKAREARRICAMCPERVPCLEWAVINNPEYGVWSGTTPKERELLRRKIRRNARTA